MATVTAVIDDTAIEFPDTLTINGTAVNLTGATVLFLLKLGTTAYSLSASLVVAASGTVKYTRGAGFPTVPGLYKQQWQVTYSDGTILSFPSDEYNYVNLIDDLN